MLQHKLWLAWSTLLKISKNINNFQTFKWLLWFIIFGGLCISKGNDAFISSMFFMFHNYFLFYTLKKFLLWVFVVNMIPNKKTQINRLHQNRIQWGLVDHALNPNGSINRLVFGNSRPAWFTEFQDSQSCKAGTCFRK